MSLCRVMPLFSAIMRATVVFPVPERPVKDHIGNAPALDGAAEHPPRSQQMLLPAHIRQRFGTQALRKWFIHGGFSFPARKALFI